MDVDRCQRWLIERRRWLSEVGTRVEERKEKSEYIRGNSNHLAIMVAVRLSRIGICPLQPKHTAPPSKFIVRAARTEFQVVSLGFRAADFQSQDVAKDFEAVCMPEFFLFRKVTMIMGSKPGEIVSTVPNCVNYSEIQCGMQHKVAFRGKAVIFNSTRF
ncbi:hypothetical protein HS088_TW15G00946 [Tripterygium wilfordii]|uniref:Uncharacterized protein n=1 Tax=Tripterygium wilfordii TaxID=458696 RepID=A0A7J7CN03_TRIWF|nr:hypothetical protein HS088_TW15G00946 [Tripterygium wilfordii]